MQSQRGVYGRAEALASEAEDIESRTSEFLAEGADFLHARQTRAQGSDRLPTRAGRPDQLDAETASLQRWLLKAKGALDAHAAYQAKHVGEKIEDEIELLSASLKELRDGFRDGVFTADGVLARRFPEYSMDRAKADFDLTRSALMPAVSQYQDFFLIHKRTKWPHPDEVYDLGGRLIEESEKIRQKLTEFAKFTSALIDELDDMLREGAHRK
jgi:hypothetical protein